MKFKVNKNLCIGCGACQALAPEIFEIEDDGLAGAKTEANSDTAKEEAVDAMDNCPTSAISEEK